MRERVDIQRGEHRGFMSSGELCTFLGLKPRQFRRWQQSGKAPPPAYTSPAGWGFWSPEQQLQLMRLKAGIDD